MGKNTTMESLMEEVNPVYMTAQRCLQIVARLGDEDSQQLCGALGLPGLEESLKVSDRIPKETAEALALVMPVFNAIPEARFLASTDLIKSMNAKQVVDLPCGYTARGIKLAKCGIRYFGFDLPAVTGTLGGAVKQITGEDRNLKYRPVDATNYNSLRKALEGAQGELFITTEGMLMYFTQNELETVFSNIRKLLSEYGGRWVTVDSELDIAQKKIMKIMSETLPADRAERVGPIVSEWAGKTSKTTLLNNRFFDPDPEKVKQFVSDMGFDLERIPMKDHLPEALDSFRDLPPDIRKQAMDALGEVHFWVMTVRAKSREVLTAEEESFRADVSRSGNVLNISLAGRLDTMTSPTLLSLYKEAAESGGMKAIRIDMKELEYISSAGLRVLLIMKKALGDGNGFSLVNMNDPVRDILETTGFDTIFV